MFISETVTLWFHILNHTVGEFSTLSALMKIEWNECRAAGPVSLNAELYVSSSIWELCLCLQYSSFVSSVDSSIDIMQRIKCLLSHRFEFHYILVERISNLQWKICVGILFSVAVIPIQRWRWEYAMAFLSSFCVRWTWPFWTVAQCVLFLFCKIMLLNPREWCAIPRLRLLSLLAIIYTPFQRTLCVRKR